MERYIKIAPSILAADFSKLGKEIQAIAKAGADYIHIDVMDGHFVPNLTLGMPIIKNLRKHTSLPFDVHLMITEPERYIKDFSEAGADIITIHAEACTHLDSTIKKIQSYGKKAGVSLIPSTPENSIDYILEELDLILVMSVNPGFGGQSFITSQLKKIAALRQKINNSGKKIELQVDGGITAQTAKLAIEAGADVLVAGTAVFQNHQEEHYQRNISQLRSHHTL